MKHKVLLFLDFDGVLHPYPLRIGGPYLFHQVPRLQEILKEFPEVGVVVHSSWRTVPQYEGDDGIPEFLRIGDAYLGITNPDILSRWESIADWLRNDGRPHVILDDFGGSFPTEARPNLICTEGILGMTEENWQELRRRLQGFRDGG